MSKYSNEFKLKVVKYCIEEHHGVKDAAKHFAIPAHSTVQKWVNKYNEHGAKGLVKNLNKEVEEDLIAENQRLRMENEYLKKLNALVQERIKRENKKK